MLRPNQDDCKIYQITPEKQPRVEEPSKTPALNVNDESRYDSGAYFPSGLPSRSEVEQEKVVEEDNWTSINKNLEESGGAPLREDRTTQVPSLFEPVPVEETTTEPVPLSDSRPIYPTQVSKENNVENLFINGFSVFSPSNKHSSKISEHNNVFSKEEFVAFFIGL